MQAYFLQKKPEDVLLFISFGYETTGQSLVRFGITLTLNTRDKRKMAGFPHHALDSYLPKLIRAGHRVAICDQLEAPKKSSKKIEKAS